MMGHHSDAPRSLFCYNANLEDRIPVDHELRLIKGHIDFEFVYDEVKDRYGERGNISIPPPAILKMMLLLVLYNVRSERELMKTIPLRLDWLWFLDYDLESVIPNHSVVSKARRRWGAALFKTFFERVVWQCVEAGLVDGSKLFVDSSLIRADASANSVVKKDAMQLHIAGSYQQFEARLDEHDPLAGDDLHDHDDHPYGHVNRSHHSTTDPDASVVRQGKDSAKLQYKVHRGVDEKAEVITAVAVTPGIVNEAHRLVPLLEDHCRNTEREATTVVADTKYGTVDNYLACHDRGIAAHIPDLKTTQDPTGRRGDIFPEEAFRYDPDADIYCCPGNQILTRRTRKPWKGAFQYAPSRGVCRQCALRAQCTKSETGRTIRRYLRHDDLTFMRQQAQSLKSRQDIMRRQHLMERSFAQGVRYGFKRARWRRLWRVQIQEYLTAAVQNIMIFLRHVKEQRPAQGMAAAILHQGVVSIRRVSVVCVACILRVVPAAQQWSLITPQSNLHTIQSV